VTAKTTTALPDGLYDLLLTEGLARSLAVSTSAARTCRRSRAVQPSSWPTSSLDTFGFHYQQTTALRADPSEPAAGTLLSWSTFTGAAREAGESRIYGGIHFDEGNVVGLDIGRRCGEAAYAKAQDLWSGA